MQGRVERHWVRATGWAIVLYLILGLAQIRQKPGLQHDEALLVLGAVQMRHAPHQELTVPHDPDTWVQAFGVWFPLMTARYVGAVKEFLCLPIFAVFGTRTAFVRLVSMLLGALGIWGIGRLVCGQVGPKVAGIAALALAINPSYVANTVFDNGTVAAFMAALGLMCLAISMYLRRGGTAAAFAVGFTVGFGVWARVNFIWLAAAILAAAVLILRGQLLRISRSHWLAAAAGATAGCLPLIVYQIVSGGGTWQAVNMFATHESFGRRLYTRLIMFSELLLSDREHRAMWGGAMMPAWQRWFFPAVVAGSCAAALLLDNLDRRRTVWARVVAIAFLLFAAALFGSGLMVAEHHLVELLPLAVVLVTLAGDHVNARFPRAKPAVLMLAVLYAGCCLEWQAAAITGLHQTGGVGPWSDGLVPLAMNLERNYPGREIRILDWGLQNNLYVVSDGRVQTRDVYGLGNRKMSGLGRPWDEEVRQGGVFVYFAADRQMPDATEGFLAALDRDSPLMRRSSISRRDGAAYAEVVEVYPETLHMGAGSRVATADPGAADRLEGFYQIESGRWRWSKPRFAITLDAPPVAGAAAARLTVEIFIPDAVIQQLGSVTLSARDGEHALAPETWRQPGSFTFSRDLRPEWLKPGANRIEFALAKPIPPREGDRRELGIIVQSAALEAVR